MRLKHSLHDVQALGRINSRLVCDNGRVRSLLLELIQNAVLALKKNRSLRISKYNDLTFTVIKLVVDPVSGFRTNLAAQIIVVDQPVDIRICHVLIPRHHHNSGFSRFCAHIFDCVRIDRIHNDRVNAGRHKILKLINLSICILLAVNDRHFISVILRILLDLLRLLGPYLIAQCLNGESDLQPCAFPLYRIRRRRVRIAGGKRFRTRFNGSDTAVRGDRDTNR